MFGQNGTGLNFKAQSADILNPSTVAQADQTYGQSQQALQQQQQLVQALQAQNGIQNQSNVFNQLQGVANGTGPNPAQAMLAQATQANTANQAALMAGQRGSAQNVGLIGRQAAQQGAANQQNAAGQAATMQANQSLGALNQLGGIAGQQVGQQIGATGTQLGGAQQANQNVLQSIAGQNTANVNNMQQMNAANAGIAGIAAQGQEGMISGLGSAAGTAIMPHKAYGGPINAAFGYPGQTMGVGEGAVPAAPTVPPIQSDNRSLMTKHAESFKPGMFSDMVANSSKPNQVEAGWNTLGTGLASLASPRAPSQQAETPITTKLSPSDFNAKQIAAPVDRGMPDASLYHSESAQPLPDQSKSRLAKGGKVPAMVSPGEVYLPPQKVQEVKAKGNKPGDAIKEGEKIPGKAKVKGNSYANDTVHRNLEEGGLVIPKSVMESKDPKKEAAKFVQAYMARGGLVKRGKK